MCELVVCKQDDLQHLHLKKSGYDKLIGWTNIDPSESATKCGDPDTPNLSTEATSPASAIVKTVWGAEFELQTPDDMAKKKASQEDIEVDVMGFLKKTEQKQRTVSKKSVKFAEYP